MKVMPTREAWSLVVSEKVGSSNRTCKPKKLAGGRKIILVRGEMQRHWAERGNRDELA